MEHGDASRLTQLLRMDDHDRISQASVATISYFPVIKESSGKVQTFGKRCQAAKRDPNCPVVIRGWLNKKDSSGLKLWKRRWFVLSNYCLFYYKDSREETVMGSIPLPSYKILFCTPRECKNRKFMFKVVHQGMRSYFFSADTQEDMLGWVRALSQSASMETDGTLNRLCSSYQDFTKIGSSSESVDLTKPICDGEGPALKHRHISRTLSEPSHLTGGRMGTTHSEHRGRRTARQRSSRTPSPADFNRRRACGPDVEDILPGQNTPPTQAEMLGQGSLTPRAQLGSRPHTPVGRVDIRPRDDSRPQTLYYTPASPKLESSATPTTPVTERWQNLNKPSATYGSVHHSSSGRRPLGKSFSTGAHADLLPPLPPSSRATHAPSPTHHHHHHHHRSSLSVCVLPPAMSPKIDQREIPPMRPLESDADTVLTRLCGCDKLLQSLSVELAQLQMDKDGVQCALEVSRLQLEKWKNPDPRAQEEALAQKALLQEELVTIRARMGDVSMEMERVWSQYERMESELSVIRSYLQHICNFGMPQEHCQAQRELWMMEDILAGLKINRDHFCFLLGLQRHHRFYQAAPHPGSCISPTDRLPAGLPMDEEQDPPVRPPLPLELLEKNLDHAWTESPYEGIYSHTDDHRRANIQPEFPNVKDKFESQSGLKWTPPESRSQSNKKIKMSEEEQIERMKRNQERLVNRKKPFLSSPGSQRLSQGSETKEEPPFPLRVTRVVTAVLPSSLVARRVSVEDPPPELSNPLPEQIQADVLQRPSEERKRTYSKPSRRLLLESPDQIQPSAEMHPDQPVMKANRQQSTQAFKESRPEGRRAEPTETSRTRGAVAREHTKEQPPATLTLDMDADLCLTAEQRQAKLRRVERIRERVMKSAVRESVSTNNPNPTGGERKDAQVSSDSNRKERPNADFELQHRSCEDSVRIEPHLSSGTVQEMDEIDRTKKKCKNPNRFGIKTQHKDHSERKGHIKRPDSPYHVSSMVYQKSGGRGFTVCKNENEQKLEGPAADNDTENDLASCDVRAKWFLSTNHWQGFIPLPCKDSPSDSNVNDHLPDSGEMSPAVSESLEKMKDNYSLFYKIACDISISDTDIAKNDGQTSPGPEEKEPLIIIEAVEETNQESEEDKNVVKDLTPETQDKSALSTSTSPAKEDRFPDGTPQNGNEDIVCQEDLKLRESPLRSSGEVTNGDHSLDGKANLGGEDSKAKVLKSSSSLNDEQKDKVQEREFSLTRPSSACEAGSGTRSASLGKARFTVVRTSF